MGPEQNVMKNEELPMQEPRSSTEIESDIHTTRSRMDATLDELGDRLTARSLLNSALDWWESRGSGGRTGGATKDAYQSIARYVRENPIPSVLLGTGLVWMIIDATSEEETPSRRESPTYRGTPTGSSYSSEYVAGDQVETGESGGGIAGAAKDKLVQAKETVAEVAGTAKEKVAAWSSAASEAAEGVGRRTHEVYEQGRSTGVRMSDSIQRGYRSGTEQLEIAMQEYPLAVGLSFAALGALVGVLLPHTRREDQLLGERSDQVVEAAKEKGQELLERGKDVAERVAGSALDEARQQGLTPQVAGETISGLAGKVGEVARKAKEETGAAMKETKLTPETLKREASAAAGGGKQQERKAGAQKKSNERG
jgi:ElaB/YqjD/DUF883 family membrane-anchored ribosome-binding protein